MTVTVISKWGRHRCTLFELNNLYELYMTVRYCCLLFLVNLCIAWLYSLHVNILHVENNKIMITLNTLRVWVLKDSGVWWMVDGSYFIINHTVNINLITPPIAWWLRPSSVRIWNFHLYLDSGRSQFTVWLTDAYSQHFVIGHHV